MDEIAARAALAPELSGKTYAGPVGTVVPPAGIVPFPQGIKYNQTYARGRDAVDGWLVVVVGRPPEPQTRDLATLYTDGAGPSSMVTLFDQPGWVAADHVDIIECDFDAWQVGGIDYLAIIFTWRAIGPGNG